MRRLVTTLATAVTIGPLLAAPPAAAAITARAASVKTTVAFSMPAPGFKAVQSLTLGAGPWTVIAKAFAVQVSGTGDIVRCQIYDVTHNKALDGAAGAVNPWYPGNIITNIAKLAVPSGAAVQVQQRCGHDGTGGNPSYLDPGATLLAFKAKTAPGNRLARTTGQTRLGLNPATVASVGLSAGTWLVGYKATGVYFDPSNVARASCHVGDSYAFRVLSGRAGSTSVATLTGFTVVTTSTSRSLAMTCTDSGGTGAAYLDPGSVLWARQVSTAFVGHTCDPVTGASAANDLVIDSRTDINDEPRCAVGGGTFASPVGGAAVAAATWVVLGAEMALSSPTDDWFRCNARDVTHNKVVDAGATAWLHGQDGYTETAYAGLLKITTGAVVEFRCGHDDANQKSSSSINGSYVLLRP